MSATAPTGVLVYSSTIVKARMEELIAKDRIWMLLALEGESGEVWKGQFFTKDGCASLRIVFWPCFRATNFLAKF